MPLATIIYQMSKDWVLGGHDFSATLEKHKLIEYVKEKECTWVTCINSIRKEN